MSRRSPAALPHAAVPLPFARPIAVRRLPRRRTVRVDIAAEPDELPAIARFLGLDALRSLRLRGELAAMGEEEWRVTGRLEADLVQRCVVTLAPVESRIDQQVARRYLPEESSALPAAIDVDPDAEDDPDPYGASIDPGALAIESLALALDPYPRAPGVPPTEFSATPPGAEPLSGAGPKPFADLAELMRKLDENGQRGD